MVEPKREVVYPHEIPVDPGENTKAIFVHVDHGLLVPKSMVGSYEHVDNSYTHDRAARFRFMASGVLRTNGLPFDRTFVHNERDANSRELLLVLSPLNDGRPESGPERITNFVEKADPSRRDAALARPNSHRPAAKLDADYEFGHAEGLGMPRYQIFAREAPAMSRGQRKRVANGDMTPYGELALRGIAEAGRLKNEAYGTGGFERINIFAAGMGAKALGAALEIVRNSDYQLGSVTLMNFALGEQSVAKLSKNYTRREMVGEASKLILPKDYVRVPEFTVLSQLDKRTELAIMRTRQAKALINWRMATAIMNAKHGVEYIEELLANGATITVANGVNEAMVSETDHYLPIGDGQLFRTKIVGVEGKEVGMATNEHGAVLVLVSNLGIVNHRQRQT